MNLHGFVWIWVCGGFQVTDPPPPLPPQIRSHLSPHPMATRGKDDNAVKVVARFRPMSKDPSHPAPRQQSPPSLGGCGGGGGRRVSYHPPRPSMLSCCHTPNEFKTVRPSRPVPLFLHPRSKISLLPCLLHVIVFIIVEKIIIYCSHFSTPISTKTRRR